MWRRTRDTVISFIAAVVSAIFGVLALTRLARKNRPDSLTMLEEEAQERAERAGGLAVSESNQGQNEQQSRMEHKTKPGWSIPQPEELPKPTYWPAVMSLGIVLLLWGVVTSALISGMGLVLFGLSLAGWIGEIRHENGS